MAFPFSPIDSPAVLHSMNTPHCVWGQYCLLEYIVLRIPPKILPALQLSLQNDDLITSYPDLNRAICCYLDVSMPRSLSYYLHSKTNRNNVFWRRGVFLTSVLKRNVLLARLVKLAHNVLKSALTSGDKTNLFSWNISHTTLVFTLNRKLSANIKMFLKQIKQSTSIKHCALLMCFV